MTPPLSTFNLVLVPYEQRMLRQQHIDWLNNPETMKYSEQRHRKHTMDTQRVYLWTFPKNSHIWLIEYGPPPTPELKAIGTITAYIDEPNKTANMGILLGERHGEGHGLAAWTTVMDFLFANGIRKVEAGCMSVNDRMRILCTKAHMTIEGVSANHFLFEGKPCDLIHYGRTA
jgi:ribosomal-protein-alanine N-acetyltransferase